MTQGYIYGGMRIRSLSWWDRLLKRKCSFCGRLLKGKMLFGYTMDRGGCTVIAESMWFFTCVNVKECEKVEEDNTRAANEAEKKKHQQAIKEAKNEEKKMTVGRPDNNPYA